MPDPSQKALRAPDPGTGAGRNLVSRSQAVCVYAEPLLSGRRVVVVGDASRGLGEQLLELGARTVHLYDPDASRAERAASVSPPARGLIVRALPPLPGGEFDVRDGAFDVAIVFDLGAIASRDGLLARLRRLLARGGAALIGAQTGGTESHGALDYYELYDLVALQFSHVRMIAEVPFAGVALADLGLEGQAPDVTVDTQLAGEREEPTRFLALASQEEVRLSEYAIIELPRASSGLSAAARDAAPSRVDSDAGHAALAAAQLRATLLEAQLDELKIKASQKLEELADSQRAELEARLAAESARLADADARAKEHYLRAERFSHEVREAATELSREHDRATALEGALLGAEASITALRGLVGGLEARLAEREAELQVAANELAEARAARAGALDFEVSEVAEHYAAELAELERALRERAQVVLELEKEVARRERIVRELLGSLEEARTEASDPSLDVARGEASPAAVRERELARMELATVRRDLEARDALARAANERAASLVRANDALRARLDAMALEMARREGERQDVAWRVTELEQQISRLEAEQTELVVTLPPPPMGRPRGDDAAPSSRGPVRGPGPVDGLTAERVAELQAELDVLRQAMAQEHEARVRIESGEELAKARAELTRQALLLEQLSKELDARDRARLAESPASSAAPSKGSASREA